jgi:hypothetical protein
MGPDRRGTRSTGWLSRLGRSLLLPPLVIALVIVGLGLLKVNGSSIAELDPGGDSPALLDSRPIRSDEWSTRTPLVVRQARLDYPKVTDNGMGLHDTGVLTDLPVKNVSAIIKPHSWGYFVLGVERGFALEWWLSALGPLLGVYAVMAMLTHERAISLLSGALVAASPIAGWWEIPTMGLAVLYGGVTAALLIAAGRRRGRARLLFAAVAGWTAAGFASILYLPWIVPLALLFLPLVVSQLVSVVKGWKEWVILGVAFGGVFAVLMAVFYLQHHVALKAIADSVYPGQRRTPSGEAEAKLVFDAPFDLLATSPKFKNVSGINQSAAASGLMLWVPLALVGGAFRGLKSRRPSDRALPVTMVVGAALMAWSFLPVPSILGAVVGLTRVQGARLVLPLTVVGAIAAGLYVQRLRRHPAVHPPIGRIIAAATMFAAITGWVGVNMSIEGQPVDRWKVIVLTLIAFVFTVGILAGRIVLGLGVATAMLVASFVRINPIQIGLDPITANPLVAQIDALRAGNPSARWAALGDGYRAKSLLTATGAPSASGVSWYAQPDAWHRLDPDDLREPQWNRFALIGFIIDETHADVFIDLTAADSIRIFTPSCNGALQKLDVAYVVSPDALPQAQCLLLIDKPAVDGEGWIYQVQ